MTHNTMRFIFTWPADMASACQIMNATGCWRHGSVHYADGYQVNESVSYNAWLHACEGVGAELRAQGIPYSVVFGTYER